VRDTASWNPCRFPHVLALRVRPETSWGITEFSEHQANGREAEEGERIVIEVFPVLGEPSTAIEPADGAFDNPALGQYDEAFDMIAPSDDLGNEIGHDACQTVVEHWPGIGAVGKQLPEKRELPEQGGQQQKASVAVLNIGRRDQRVQQQAQRINENVALLALDQLARIVPMRIDARPPFSALFTLWLSTIQAVGLALCSLCSRHLT
jgi:hypothetical protein